MVQLELGGKKWPFQITPRVLDLWMTETGKGFNDMANLGQGDIIALAWHGVRSAFKKENSFHPEFKRETFNDWWDDEEAFTAQGDLQRELVRVMEAMGGAEEDGDDDKASPPGNELRAVPKD
mgnify:CR=1 FL=1